MREAKNSEEAIRSRLQSVLAGNSVRDQSRSPGAPARTGPPALATPPAGRAVTAPSWPAADEGPLAWSDLIPAWADEPARPGSGGHWARTDGDEFRWRFEEEGGEPAGEPEKVGARIGAGAFDPGRRGVKALAVVALVVVAIAGFLAWRARPQVDPVPPVVEASEPAVPAAKPSAASEVVVAVAGKVYHPGLVYLPLGSRVADAIKAAGGARPGVDVAPLNLARKLVDGEMISVGVPPPPGSVVAAGGATAGPLNLNTATLADLDTLPGVGPVLAQRILDARDAQGGFRSVSDLRKVSGIGDSRYEQLKDLVTV